MADAINAASEKRIFHVWAWVFMPEHVHLLIMPTIEYYEISSILGSIKLSVSRRIISKARKEKANFLLKMATNEKGKPYRFWMPGGGYDRNMNSDKAIRNSVEYIHNNPVRRGLTANAVEWDWSSAWEWELDIPGPIRIDKDFFPVL